MNIADEAVEAAAAANFGSKLGWADAGDAYKAAARAQARRMLEAAAPHMQGYVPENHTGTEVGANPYRSQA